MTKGTDDDIMIGYQLDENICITKFILNENMRYIQNVLTFVS